MRIKQRYQREISSPGLEAEVVHSDPWTFVRARQTVRNPNTDENIELRGIGFAKRAPEDPPVPMVGEELALARAKKEIREKRLELRQHS